jgi:tetratricopeptide (TPR) repeat protein/energy-coupling factor transporter ATP-binding protein EcfA2
LTTICPYRGLSAFREEDAPLFFGRDAVIQRLIHEVQKSKLVSLVGSSGSGKSSLVSAGLVAAMRGPGSPRHLWKPMLFTPGRTPYLNLAVSLVRTWTEPNRTLTDIFAEAHQLSNLLSGNQIPLAPYLAEAVGKLDDQGLLLVVDQFEELFTLAPISSQSAFLEMLLNAASQEPRLHILFAIRADYYGHVIAASRSFADHVVTIPLGGMRRQELVDAIVRPAHATGVSFENGLIDRILDDTEVQPGGLPLLEFTLSELWHSSSGEQLTHSLYDKVGGIKEVITQSAENVYRDLNASQRKSAMRILARLIHVGSAEDTNADAKQGIDYDDLSTEEKISIDPFIRARLLVIGCMQTASEEGKTLSPIALYPNVVELAHEALWGHWARLKEQVNSNRAFLLWLQRLHGQINAWESTGRHETALIRGPLLVDASRWMSEREEDLQQGEKAFIKICEGKADEEDLRVTIMIGNQLYGLCHDERWLDALTCHSEVEAFGLASSIRKENERATALLTLALGLQYVGRNETVSNTLNEVLLLRKQIFDPHRTELTRRMEFGHEMLLTHALARAGMWHEATEIARDIKYHNDRVNAALDLADYSSLAGDQILLFLNETTAWARTDKEGYWRARALAGLMKAYIRIGSPQIADQLAYEAIQAIRDPKRSPQNDFNDICVSIEIANEFADARIGERALEFLADAISTARKEPNDPTRSYLFRKAGTVLTRLGRLDDASAAFDEAMSAALRSDGDNIFWILKDLILALIPEGNFKMAEQALHELVRALRERALPRVSASVHLGFLGWAASQWLSLGCAAETATLIQEIQSAASAVENPSERASALCAAANALMSDALPGGVREILRAAYVAAAAVEDPKLRVRFFGEIGHLFTKGEWLSDASDIQLEACSHADKMPPCRSSSLILAMISVQLQRLHIFDRANDALDHALRLADGMVPTQEDPVPYPAIAIALANIDRLREAQSVADRAGSADDQLEGYTAILCRYLITRQPECARRLPDVDLNWKDLSLDLRHPQYRFRIIRASPFY